MPSHELHRKVGLMMGLSLDTINTANMKIDFPDRFPGLAGLGIKHDDDRKFAMNIIRRELSQEYGDEGVLAADLHYSLDYIDTWLNPSKVKGMREEMLRSDRGYPRNRRGFVDPIRRWWYERPSSHRVLLKPITSYCKMCKGSKKPINAPPFCNECHASSINLSEITELRKDAFLAVLLPMLDKKMDERQIDQRVRGFIVEKLSVLLDLITEDRRARGEATITLR